MKAIKIFAALLAAGILLAGCGTAEKSGQETGRAIHYSNGLTEGHSWVYVTMNGKSYHIDPTYGLVHRFSYAGFPS